MNFFQFDCFAAVADAMSFSKGAKKLFLSQSAASQNISALEKELGFELFARKKGGAISLTPAGRYLLDAYRQTKQTFDVDLEKARRISRLQSGTLTIGYGDSIVGSWFNAAVGSFGKMEPGVTLDLHKKPVSSLAEDLEAGKIDGAILMKHELDATPDIEVLDLTASPCCVYVPLDHPAAKNGRVSLKFFDEDVFIIVCNPNKDRTLTRSAQDLYRYGFSFGKTLCISNEEVAFVMVEAGLGIFVAAEFCEEYASRFRICSVVLEEDIPDVVLCFAYRKASSLAKLFASCVKDAYESKHR